MSEVIHPIIGLSLATIFIAYRRGWIRATVECYKQIDSSGIVIDSIILLASPFLAVRLFKIFEALPSNVKELNPVLSTTLQATATGFGIIIGNTVINNIKNSKDICDFKKILSSFLSGHKRVLKTLKLIASYTAMFKGNCFFEEEPLQAKLSRVELDVKRSYERIIKLKNEPNYDKVLFERKLLSVDELEVLNKYLSDIQDLIGRYEYMMLAVNNGVLKNDCENADNNLRFIIGKFDENEKYIGKLIEEIDDCRQKILSA